MFLQCVLNYEGGISSSTHPFRLCVLNYCGSQQFRFFCHLKWSHIECQISQLINNVRIISQSNGSLSATKIMCLSSSSIRSRCSSFQSSHLLFLNLCIFFPEYKDEICLMNCSKFFAACCVIGDRWKEKLWNVPIADFATGSLQLITISHLQIGNFIQQRSILLHSSHI